MATKRDLTENPDKIGDDHPAPKKKTRNIPKPNYAEEMNDKGKDFNIWRW